MPLAAEDSCSSSLKGWAGSRAPSLPGFSPYPCAAEGPHPHCLLAAPHPCIMSEALSSPWDELAMCRQERTPQAQRGPALAPVHQDQNQRSGWDPGF